MGIRHKPESRRKPGGGLIACAAIDSRYQGNLGHGMPRLQVMWNDLPEDIQSQILRNMTLFDADTIAILRNVCKAWRRAVQKDFELMFDCWCFARTSYSMLGLAQRPGTGSPLRFGDLMHSWSK